MVRHGRTLLPDEVAEAEAKHIRSRRKEAGTKDDSPLVGLALSGGGIRSATFCLGVIQSFARSNVLRFADFLSTVSGGGYIGSCMSSLLSREKNWRPEDPYAWESTESEPYYNPSLDPNEKTDQGDGGDVDKERVPSKTEDSTKTGHSGKMEHSSTTEAADKGKGAGEKQKQGEVGEVEEENDRKMPFLSRIHIHHLRSHGDYLIPHRGLVSRDLLRTVGMTVSGLVYTLGLFLFFLVLVSGLTLKYIRLIVGSTDWIEVTAGDWPDILSLFVRDYSLSDISTSKLITFIGIPALFVTLIALLIVRLCPSMRKELQETREGEQKKVLMAYLAGVSLTALISPLLWLSIHPNDSFRLHLMLMPCAFCLSAFALTTLLYGLLLTVRKIPLGPLRQSLITAILGGYAQLLLVLVLLGVLPILTQLITRWYEFAVTILPSLIATGLSARRGRRGDEKVTKLVMVKEILTKLALRLAVPVLILVSFIGCCRALYIHFDGEIWWFVGASLIVLVLGGLFNFNRISPHQFYKNRLSDTFLRTDDLEPNLNEPVIVRDDRGMRLVDLHGRTAEKETDKEDANKAHEVVKNWAPYHLVVCAVNLAGSRDLARRDRKSDHFIFARDYCGSTTTGYLKTGVYRSGRTTLATAVTISGAAVSSGMGRYTSFLQAFAMTLFNMRLGVWLTNPKVYEENTVYNKYRSDKDPPDKSLLDKDLPKRTRKLLRLRKWGEREGLVWWPYYLTHEMLGLTNARRRLVNLSDGGHTGDNLGIYPLLQRRCRVIISCDAGADPEYKFQSVANAIRLINVDENVKVEIDLREIKPTEPEGRSTASFVVGRIEYPEEGPACLQSFNVESDRNVGWLIYLKSSLSEKIPAAVESYKADNPDFPHQSTGDQFFDDAQFESYRTLGEHIADDLLNSVRSPGKYKSLTVDDLVSWCKWKWEWSNRA